MATYYTSFDKGHRHTVTIPRGMRGFGQLGATADWYRVYQASNFVGWAWAKPSDVGLFNAACGNVIRGEARGGFWEMLFGSRNPHYNGASGWFQIWHRPTQSFVGWYMLGYFTAKTVGSVCPTLDVFTSQGQRV